jgi:hypothetical protein
MTKQNTGEACSPVSDFSAGFTPAIFALAWAARTQNAPRRIAPTKTNTAHTASISIFKVRATEVTSLVDVPAA